MILVFGVETVYRGFQKNRFAPRKKGAIYICWAVIILLTVLSWIPTQVRRSTLSKCSFGLLSIVKPWSDIALGIAITFIVLDILIASILATQLFRSTGVNTLERVATTQMIYYLAIATAVFVSSHLAWTGEFATDECRPSFYLSGQESLSIYLKELHQ